MITPTTTDEARAIWASMDERWRLLMAKTAPSYASKWGEVFAGDSEHEFRSWHHDTPLPGYVEKQSHDGRWHAFCFGELDGSYKRRADAKSAVDANRGCSKENAPKFVAAAASAGLGPVYLFELFESLRRNTTVYRNGERVWEIRDVKAARLAEGMSHAMGAPFSLPVSGGER